MQRAFADRDEQRGFCRKLEQMLRQGEADAALDLARERMRSIANICPQLVERTLATRVEDIALTGWDELAARITAAEKYGNDPVTALGIDFSWPGHFASALKDGKAVLAYDAQGGFKPVLETSYYGDMREVKFSTAVREQILAGYSSYGSEWQGSFINVDDLIGVTGLDLLYGAIQSSEARDSDTAAGDAYVLAACVSAILLHLAVKRTVETHGLPKPLAVLVGSNEDFPFFDAPVMSVDESARFVAVFERTRAQHRAEADAAEARAQAEREEQHANHSRFDPFEAMEHFGEAAKAGRDIFDLVRKEKDIFLGIGVAGLAFFAHHLRSRK